MITKTIFDLVMPDLPERQAKLESIIASHSNPTFAAQVCRDLTPLFYFYAQKSWEILKDPQMMAEVEEWFIAANKHSTDFIKMLSWLLLLIEQKNLNENHKLIHRMIARHLANTDRHKPKFRNRLLKVIDNAGNKVGALALFNDETKSLIDEIPNNVEEEDEEEEEKEGDIYINDENTFLDKYGKINLKPDSITVEVESLTYEIGKPRLESFKKGEFEQDSDKVKVIKQELLKLNKKKSDGTLSDDERKQRNFYLHLVYKGRIRYDKPQTDKATANIRRGFKYFCTKLDEKIENPKFGSDFVKEGFRSGRACIWKDKGICRKKENHHIPDFEAFSQYLPINTTDEERIKAQASWETLSDEQKKLWLACYAMDTQARRFYLEGVLLQQANLADLNLINTFYEAGRQKDLFVAYDKPDSLEEIYEMVREKDVDAYSGYLGDKNNFFKYLESGLSYYKII